MPNASRLAGLDREVAHLRDIAAGLARSWATRARSTTSIGQERAILRLFGIDGLDAQGRPLVHEVIDRYMGGSADRLATGIALPFSMALVEYDTTPRQLALDVASGAVDLGLEAELLLDPGRRVAAEARARRSVEIAFERIDANRTAGRELVDMLGHAPWPWVGTRIVAATVSEAAPEARRLVHEGADLLRIDVPKGRELVRRLREAGVEVGLGPRLPGAGGDAPSGRDDLDQAPPGSQRGLAAIRRVLDEAAAERRLYVQLAIAAPALAAPEAAVVAAFERVDFIDADAMAEIVGSGIDPDRALADQAFGRRLQRRAASRVRLGADPLVVAPDLAAGIPSDPDTRAGRALALQLVGALLAIDDGLPADRVILAAFPAWLIDEPDPGARAAAEVALRRAVLPDHPLAIDEPGEEADSRDRSAIWSALVGGVMPATDATASVMRAPGHDFPSAARATRAAAAVAAELEESAPRGPLAGRALDHARATLTAAVEAVERLSESGWPALLGTSAGRERAGLGGDAVAQRSGSFDPLDEVLGPAGISPRE